MKHSKAEVRGKVRLGLDVRFEPQDLTSYSGLIVFQHFFAKLALKERLWRCFRHLTTSPIYGHHVVVMLLIVHLLIGHRRLRDMEYYRDDEMVKRVVGLQRLPDVSTISRSLNGMDLRSVDKLRAQSRSLVTERLVASRLVRVTLDFDGSVLSTGRHAEGTAVGFNKKKKGQRSYYPLFCTVAQTDQVLDVHHRPGNVHDSNGAAAFIQQCLAEVRKALPRGQLETRIDSAFFNETIVTQLDDAGVQFTVSVPFERFTELKGMVEGRQRWRALTADLSFFESHWKPKSWSKRYRFVFIRKQVKQQDKSPLQLDLFTPIVYGYEFKVIVTNKRCNARKVVAFHEGRGSQEGIFAELKSHCQMDYVPVTSCAGNQVFMLAGVLAHNLTREMQIQIEPQARGTTTKRAALWVFREIETLRRTVIQRAGRIIRPQGKPILSMNANDRIERELMDALSAIQSMSA